MRRNRNHAPRGRPAGLAQRPSRPKRLALWLPALAAAGGIMACDAGEAPESADPPPPPAAIGPAEPTFVTSAACERCHPEQQKQWTGSHHDLAMQPATEATVLGDFGDARFAQFPVATRFFQKDGKFFVNTEGPDGELADFEVKYTFGVHPLQQYLIEFPGERLQSLTIAWDTGERRWFSLYPGERIPSGDLLHWTGRYQRWNTMCADCHSTDLRKDYDVATDRYTMQWSDIDVGCEACHGPGSAHVAWAEAAEASGVPASGHHELVIDFKTGDSRYEVEVCAPCHSRRHRVSGESFFAPPFLDHFMPEMLRTGLYHADGQVDGEVYVYGSFTQSRVYHRGVRCVDCHEPHSLTLLGVGNGLCALCHQEKPDQQRFPTLVAKRYDTPEHHFHPEGGGEGDGSPGKEGSGTACVDCHMQARVFMGVDPRHDHSLRVPRPDLTVAYEIPNACNACHADKSAEWSVEAVARWYGPERRQEPHYGAVFAAARAGAPEAAAGLIALAGDAELPAIVRATAVELLEPYGREAFAAIAAATRDGDALVRAAAVAALDPVPPEQRLSVAAPRLDDPVRAVRVEAARVLAAVPSDRFDPNARRAFAAALVECRAAQRAMADTAEAHFNLAVLHADQGEIDRAEKAYRTSIAMDPEFLPARFNLATFYNELRRNADAERVLREGLVRFPDEGELHYSLGLLLSEEQRLEEAVEELARAAELLPGRARVRYNFALALQHLGRRDEAEAALLSARATDPSDPGIVHAVAVFYLQQGDWERARPYAQQLVALVPGAPGPLQMLKRIEAELSAGGGAAVP
jgi:tetratricopeptide (TPR) repeat protein